MKTSRLLPAALLAALCLYGPGLSRAEDDDATARRGTAEQLLATMHQDRVLEDMIGRMGTQIDRITDGAVKQVGDPASQAALQQKIRTESRAMMQEGLNWETLKPEYAQAYADTFTQAELKELIAFYQTPTGQKLIAKQPDILGRVGKIVQTKAMTLMPKVLQKVHEIVQAAKPAPTPAPDGTEAPEASPAASPKMGAATPPPVVPSISVYSPAPVSTPSGTPAVHPDGKSEPRTP